MSRYRANLERFYAAIDTSEFAAAVEFLGEDVDWIWGGVPQTGRAAVQKFLAGGQQSLADRKHRIVAYVEGHGVWPRSWLLPRCTVARCPCRPGRSRPPANRSTSRPATYCTWTRTGDSTCRTSMSTLSVCSGRFRSPLPDRPSPLVLQFAGLPVEAACGNKHHRTQPFRDG